MSSSLARVSLLCLEAIFGWSQLEPRNGLLKIICQGCKEGSVGEVQDCGLRTLFKNTKNVRSKWTKKAMQAWPGCVQANKEIGHLGEAGTRKLVS